MRAIVVGAGIGGLTAALALRRAGIAVEVLEQAAALREVGAGIQITPNGTRLLQRLGLGEALSRAAVRPVALEMRRWADGALLSRMPLAGACEAAFGAPYYHLYRPDLVAALAAALPPGTIRLGQRCVGVHQGPRRVEVELAGGAAAGADLLVAADGIHSAVRDIVFGVEAPRFSGCVAYRGLVPARHLDHLGLSQTVTGWLGPHRHFVHYFVAAGRLLNFVAVVPADAGRAESWSATASAAEVAAHFAGWHPGVTGIIEAAGLVHAWGLYDRRPLARWSRGRVALLGDAAHAMLPFMAQGAVQAVEDAVVMARCLAGTDGKSLPGALSRYEAVRQPRVARVQALARANGETFHLPDGPTQRQRDAHLAAAGEGNPLLSGAWLHGHDAEAAVGPLPTCPELPEMSGAEARSAIAVHPPRGAPTALVRT